MAGKLGLTATGAGLTAALGTSYLALLTAAPSGPAATVASLAEYARAGYARVPFTATAPTGTPRQVSNSADISTAPLTGANGSTITHVALVSSSSGTSGSLIGYAAVTKSGGGALAPAANESVKFAAGVFAITID